MSDKCLESPTEEELAWFRERCPIEWRDRAVLGVERHSHFIRLWVEPDVGGTEAQAINFCGYVGPLT